MRYPYDNFKRDWNTTAGYGFGAKTSYGYHEAVDVNDNLGGNSDYGKPIFAIADGEVTSVHHHTNKPSFGNHIHYKIEGAWGTRYVHHAHCSEILVNYGNKVKKGQMIARIGNSGTTWAHDHWAIKKQATGIDFIVTNKADLAKFENPVEFVERWMDPPTEGGGNGGAVTVEAAKFEELVTKATERDRFYEFGFKGPDKTREEFNRQKEAIDNLNKLLDERNQTIADKDWEISRLTADVESLEETEESLSEKTAEAKTLKAELEQALQDRKLANQGMEEIEKTVRDLRAEIERRTNDAPYVFWQYLLKRFRRGGE